MLSGSRPKRNNLHSHLVNFSSLTETHFHMIFWQCFTVSFAGWYSNIPVWSAVESVSICRQASLQQHALGVTAGCNIFFFLWSVWYSVLHLSLRGSRGDREWFYKMLGLGGISGIEKPPWHPDVAHYFSLQPLKWEPCTEDFLERCKEQHRLNSGAYEVSIQWV